MVALITLSVGLGLVSNHLRGLPLNPVRPFVPEWAAPPLTLGEVRGYYGKVPIFDARELVEYERGHIPGAACLPASRLYQPEQAWDPLDRKTVIIVYCDGPTCGASNKVAAAALAAGFRRVYVFPGGWPAWQAAGLPGHAGPDPGRAEL